MNRLTKNSGRMNQESNGDLEALRAEGGSGKSTLRTAVITGGAGSLGVTLVESLFQADYRIVLIDVDGQRLERVVEKYSGLGEVSGICADVRDYEDLAEAIDRAARTLSGIDLLVCCAREECEKPVSEVGVSDWHRVMDTNLNGSMYASVLAAPHMTGRENSCIIHLADIHSRIGTGLHSVLSAATAGIAAMSKSLAADFAQFGIRCVSVSPYTMLTESNRALVQADPQWREVQESTVLNPGLMEPRELAEFIAFVASEDGTIFNATDIAVDGGMSIFRERPAVSPYNIP